MCIFQIEVLWIPEDCELKSTNIRPNLWQYKSVYSTLKFKQLRGADDAFDTLRISRDFVESRYSVKSRSFKSFLADDSSFRRLFLPNMRNVSVLSLAYPPWIASPQVNYVVA